jgi:hypothetical protein
MARRMIPRLRPAVVTPVFAMLLFGSGPAAWATPGQSDDPTPSADGPVLGERIYDLCSAVGDLQSGMCLTYLRGMMEGLLIGEVKGDGDTSFCLPDDDSIPNLREIFVVTFASGDATERQSEDAGQILLEGLEDSFPCPDSDDDDHPTSTDLVSYRHGAHRHDRLLAKWYHPATGKARKAHKISAE